MKKLFATSIIAGALAMAAPGAVLAAGAAGHAIGRAGGPPVLRGGAYGRVYGPRVAPYYRGYPALGFAFAYDPYWYGAGWGEYGYAYPYVVPTGDTGGLRLEIAPKTAQVFVDGYYAGGVDDFDGRFQHLDMTPGGNRIEVRQQGFEPLMFQTYIQPGHTTDYKAALTPAPAER
jgi:hypothetical protein